MNVERKKKTTRKKKADPVEPVVKETDPVGDVAEVPEPVKPEPRRAPADRTTEVREILRAKTGTTLSVRKARSGEGWIDIGGSGDGGVFVHEEKVALEPILGRLGLRMSATFATVPPYKVDALLKLFRSRGDT